MDASLEANPHAWPPGSWDHHQLDAGDTDNEPNTEATRAAVEKTDKLRSRKIPSTYPPAFAAGPSESYREWKRSVQFWIAGEGGQLPEDVIGPRVMAMLKGRASVIVRHLKIEQVSKSGGLELILQTLEASPMVREIDGQRGEKAQREFLRCKRQSGESMDSYITRVQAQHAMMQEEDESFQVGERFLVGYLLDNAEITLRDRVMILAAAQNQMTVDAIFPALRRMGPFLSGTLPVGKGVIDAPLLPDLQPDHEPARSGGEHKDRRPWHSHKAHVVLDDFEPVPDPEGPESEAELELPEELESATHEALVAYNSSQAKLRALKQARGYFKKTEPATQPDRKDRLKKLMAENPCRGCGQYGHWSKDPECPRNQAGKAALASSSSSATLVTTPSKSSPEVSEGHAAMSAVLEDMIKLQASRVYMAAVSFWDGVVCDEEESVIDAVHFALPSMANLDIMNGKMVVDLGCLRSVAGISWIVSEAERCKMQGRFYSIQRTMDYFRFGDGVRRPSHYRLFLEVGFCGHVGLLAINAVDYPCPPLLSKWVCGELGLQLDCGTGRYDLLKLGVRSQRLESSSEGHYLMNIAHFNVDWPTWTQLKHLGHEPKIKHDEIQMFEIRQGNPVGKGARRLSQGRSKPLISPSPETSSFVTKHGSSSSGEGQCEGARGDPHSHGGFSGLGGRISDRTFGRDGRGGVPRLVSTSEDQPGHPSRCVHEQSGEQDLPSSSQVKGPGKQSIGISTPSGRQEDELQPCPVQGGVELAGDRCECRLPNTRVHSQSRSSDEHVLGAAQSPDRAQVEAIRLDEPLSASLRGQPSSLASQSSLVGPDVCCGGRCNLGAYGQCSEDLERSKRATDDALKRASPFPHGSAAAERPVNADGFSTVPLQRGQTQKLKQAVKQVRTAIDRLTGVAKSQSKAPWKVLEIFGGSAALSLVARSTGQWIAIEPVDLIYGDDMLSPEEQQKVLNDLDRWEPDLVCLEPPCGPWSSLQNLNPQDLVELKRAIHMPFWLFSRAVWDKQHKTGRLVLLEQPLRSAALRLECMASRPSVFRAVVDQCCFGLKDPVSGKFYRKRSALDVNSEVFAVALTKNAQCCHTPEEHEPIEGQTRLADKWVNRSLVAGAWTSAFGMHILRCAALALTHGLAWRQRLDGVYAFVADFDEGDHTGIFLQASPGEVVCRQPGCYEIAQHGCPHCHHAWCQHCLDQHVCEPVQDPLEQVDEHMVYAVAADELSEEVLDTSMSSEELKADMEIQRMFKKLQQQEDQRRGDFSGVGARYAYIRFVGPSLRVTKAVRNQVAKLHGVFGHPSNDRLARMLHLQGARAEVVQCAKDLRCEICMRIHAPHSAPKSSATNPERFNQHCSSDSFFIWDADGQRWNVTHLVDGFCTLQYAVLSKNPSSSTSCDLLFDKWILTHGPMKELTVDGGPEFRGRFPTLCQLYDIKLNVLPTSAKWKAGLAERHGAIVKLMVLRMIHELTLKKEWELRYALAMAIQAKNRLLRRCGKSPLQVVQGRDNVIPSALLEQVGNAEVKFATNSACLEEEEQQLMERMRRSAHSAFHWLDAHERLRIALNSRSRPPHLRADALVPGTVVYFFKQAGQSKRMQDFATGYQGPAVVACADGPERLWLRFKGSVVRVAIENVRLATPEEEVDTKFILEAMEEMEQELTGGRRPVAFEEAEDQSAPLPSLPCSTSSVRAPPLEGTAVDGREDVKTSSSATAPKQNEVDLYVHQPKAEDVLPPDQVKLAHWSEDRGRQLDGLPKKYRGGPYDQPERSTVPEKVEFFEKGAQPSNWKDILSESKEKMQLDSSLQRLYGEKSIQTLRQEFDQVWDTSIRHRDVSGEPSLKTPRVEGEEHPCLEVQCEQGVVPDLPELAQVKLDLEHWALSTASSEQEVQRMKEVIAKFDAEQLERERGHRAGPEPGPRGEIYLKDMTPTEVRLTTPALIKALDIHFQYDAVEPVPPDKFVPKEQILRSRFVIVNKGWLQRTFQPKGRLCVGGHQDPSAGEYETSSPTAILLGHHLLLIVTVAKQWKARGGDITAAFLQGVPLPREKPLYITLPRNVPEEVGQYLSGKLQGHRGGVIRVLKGVFGLNESPRLWYLGLKQHLETLGFREMRLAPCVFTLHLKGSLMAMATVHVDDVLLSGDPAVESVWTELRQRLTFGSWNEMVEGFKFLGRFLKQDPTNFHIQASMQEYCVDLKEIAVGGSEPDDRALSDLEVSNLRTLVGKLSWAVRQGRPDVLFSVSLLQQSLKSPTVKELRLANVAVRSLQRDRDLHFVNLGCPIEDALVVVATDGAYGTMPGGKSQQGWIVAIANPKIKNEAAMLNLAEWQSTSCKRIVRSSMAVEASAASVGFEHGEYVRALLAEIVFEDFTVRRWSHFIQQWELALVLDAKTAFDTLRTESLPQDRRTALDLLAVKESLLDSESRSICRWLPGPQQIADAMTKEKSNHILEDCMATNQWCLCEDPEWQATRARQRANQKVYKDKVRAERLALMGEAG